jgi:hypothetical protein
MKGSLFFTLVLPCLLPICAFGDAQLGNAKVHFVDQDEGAKILTTKDDFIQRLSPFDRAGRMKTENTISEAEFLIFVKGSVISWKESEITKVESLINKIGTLLNDLPVPLPATIQLIKTTGDEEGNAAYTQGTAIVLPRFYLETNRDDTETILCHELFHVISRQNPELRERLYQAIGFSKCNEIALPASLARRRITNPDAPRNDHYIQLKVGGQNVFAVPILFSSSEKYDVKRGGNFFDYLQFKFLAVEKRPGSHDFTPIMDDASPRLLGVEQISGFFEQVGRNTEYIIHPEEILADNFAMLLQQEDQTRSPQVLKKMREVFLATAHK